MKAVILVGGVSKWLYPLSDHQPRGMLRVGNVPALRHNLLNLMNRGVTEFCIPLDAANTSVRDYFKEGGNEGINIRYVYSKKFPGTAGCLQLFHEVLRDAPFLIVNGNSFSRLDLSPLLAPSPADNPFLRIGVYGPGSNSANMYYAHPGILQWIPRNRYFDLREQLVPLLPSRGCAVQEVPLRGTVNELHSFDDYLEANHEAARSAPQKDSLASLNVRVSKMATLQGPVLIGRNTIIGAHCVIVGPAVIGSDCSIGRGVFIHRSVIDSHVRIRSNCHIQKSIVLKGADVKPHSHLLKTIGVNGVQFAPAHQRLFKSSPSCRGWGVHHTERNALPMSRGREVKAVPVYFLKRFLDVSVTALLSPVIVPLGLFLGALIKITSSGPVIFMETRLGQNGRAFTMYKLRTMIDNAHLQQDVLQEKKQGDGPMFKLEADPRVTSLGRWLRKTSLDELPQFWNVLKGDMSLVGPRPLSAREMKWNPSWKEMRLLVKPGITGLWQVKTGVYSDFSDWIIYDLQYVRNCALGLDLKILMWTVARVIRGRK